MSEQGAPNFWTTVPGVLTGLLALLTAIIGLWTALAQTRDDGSASDATTGTTLSLTVQAALLDPAERTEVMTHQVTVRVAAPSGAPLPGIDHVTYLLPPSFGSESVTSSSAEDGFALWPERDSTLLVVVS